MGWIEFYHTIGKLKQEKRVGWLDRGVKDSESVSDHSHRLCVMSLFFAKRLGLDECRAVKLAVVHDLPEAICGDVATRVKEELQKIPNREKREREEKALEELCEMLGGKEAKELRELWLEFNEGKSKEARLVYELDRLEAIFQAIEYEKKGNFAVSLQEFYDFANARLELPAIREIFDKLMEERKKRLEKSAKH